jgi:hypothetical protein
LFATGRRYALSFDVAGKGYTCEPDQLFSFASSLRVWSSSLRRSSISLFFRGHLCDEGRRNPSDEEPIAHR